MREQVQTLSIDQLKPFRNHPFRVKDDESMAALCDSIQAYGVLSPLLARPTEDGFEIVSGYRRRAAAMKLGLDELPVLVRDMTDDEAVILMVDSNLQRENLLPSEKAFAYKMKLEALNHQGKRTDLTSTTVVSKLRSNEELGDKVGESRETIRRYIRLTYLAKPILDLVDSGQIAFSPAVRLKRLSQQAELTPEQILDIMSEEKANQKERVRIEVSQIRKYFPKGCTTKQMEEAILKLLEANYKRHQRSRDAR